MQYDYAIYLHAGVIALTLLPIVHMYSKVVVELYVISKYSTRL